MSEWPEWGELPTALETSGVPHRKRDRAVIPRAMYEHGRGAVEALPTLQLAVATFVKGQDLMMSGIAAGLIKIDPLIDAQFAALARENQALLDSGPALLARRAVEIAKACEGLEGAAQRYLDSQRAGVNPAVRLLAGDKLREALSAVRAARGTQRPKLSPYCEADIDCPHTYGCGLPAKHDGDHRCGCGVTRPNDRGAK